MRRITKPARWMPVSVPAICAQIASAALTDMHSPDVRSGAEESRRDASSERAPGVPAHTLGRIELRPHQVDALQRVRSSIRSNGGALLADAVGLGKTYVALALAHEYIHVHVVAPATLLPMWREAMDAADSANVTLHSVHTFSRRAIHVESNGNPTLVIVDEAHHLRTRNTVRYRNAQQFTAGRDVLLMSATPVHNRTRELRSLLALFLGHRADALDRATLAECIVRRTASDAHSARVPTIHEHAALVIPDNRLVLEHILQLAPPLPVNEGATASALVRLGLLRAWCSSDAALTDRIRRRQLRGEALLHSLASGRYPKKRELESWIVGSDSVQLGFPELLVATTSGDTSVMIKTLAAHLDALQQLLQVHSKTSLADASRSSALRAMLRNEQQPPIIAFSQFASTVRALHRALSDLAGIASLTSSSGQIASGAIARQELIANFAPRANGRPPPGVAQRIRLLITTDLLAEGVNLQDAGTVVHLDLPWTHALKEQRIGRIARMGSDFSTVNVHTFAPPMGAEAAIQLAATLERKAGLHRDWIGHDRAMLFSDIATATSAADQATQLRNLLLTWRNSRVQSMSQSLLQSSSQSVALAALRATPAGWIAIVESSGKQTVVASMRPSEVQNIPHFSHSQESARTIGPDTSTLLQAFRATQCSLARSKNTSVAGFKIGAIESSAELALDELNGWLQTRELQTLSGSNARSISPAQKRALDTLSARLSQTSAARRAGFATLASTIEERVLSCRGAGSEHTLMMWISTATALPIGAWLAAFPVIHNRQSSRAQREIPDPNQRVIALLLLLADNDELPDESLT